MADEVSEYSPKRYKEANLEHVLNGNIHQHSHFTDVNGKDAIFEGLDFSYCVFTRAYFHNTTFSNCKFIGAHFMDCNFRNAKIRDCNFSYSSFSNTRIPTKEILNNLPAWPNVRRELLQILRRNAASIGNYRSEKAFIIREIDAEKEHYRRAWRRDEPYYIRKYNQKSKWLIAGLKLLALKIENFIWGHGERIWKTLVSLFLLLFFLSIILTFTEIADIREIKISDAINYFIMAFYYHVNLFLGLPYKSEIKGLMVMDWIVVITRFLAIGIIVAALYRRLSHR
jgi:hypothetical protein